MKLSLLLCCGFLATGLVHGAVKSVDAKQVTIPVMINREFNPVIGLDVKCDSKDKLQAVMLSVKGTHPRDIKKIEIYRSALDEKSGNPIDAHHPGTENLLGQIDGSKIRKGMAAIPCNGDLKSGLNHLWVNVIPHEKANILRKISVDVKALKTTSGHTDVTNAQAVQRIGVAITYPSFEAKVIAPKTGEVRDTRISKYSRIPGLTRTMRGTMVAVFDNRYHHNGDLPADIDVGVSTSRDGGQTWSPVVTCIAARDLPGIGNGVGDPAILIDERTNRIWVAALAAPKSGHPIWASYPGTIDPAKCGQFILAYSDDEGKTWSEPINITKEVKRLGDPDTKNWGLLFNGPGNGICMRDGTLVFPGQIWDEKDENGQKRSGHRQGVLVYSKDRGKTWTSSKAMPFGASESTVAELSDGSLMLNTREGIGGLRMVGVTKDLGETWTKHPSVSSSRGRLRNPFCQAILINIFNSKRKGRSMYQLGVDAEHLLIFSNPNAGSRCMMTLKYSKDDGNTWNDGLLYDQRGCMGYSAIYPVDGRTLGVFYEGQHGYQYYLRIPFTEITAAK